MTEVLKYFLGSYKPLVSEGFAEEIVKMSERQWLDHVDKYKGVPYDHDQISCEFFIGVLCYHVIQRMYPFILYLMHLYSIISLMLFFILVHLNQ